MLDVLITLFRSLLTALRGNRNLAFENLALRQQLMVVQRQLRRPRLSNTDRALWVLLNRLWPDWDKALILVKPATVIKWHRAGFRAFWRWKSRPTGGRPRVNNETRELIRRLLDGLDSRLLKRFHTTRLPDSCSETTMAYTVATSFDE